MEDNTPNYDFQCAGCGAKDEIFLQRFIRDDEKKRQCKCGQTMEYVINLSEINFTIHGFCYRNEAAADKQTQMAQEAMNEPLTRDEIERLPDIAAEEEKRRGLEPGTILQGPNQREQIPIEVSKDSGQLTGKINDLKEAKREKFKKKAAEQRKMIEKSKSSDIKKMFGS